MELKMLSLRKKLSNSKEINGYETKRPEKVKSR
jgi:hypothetical protein